MINIENDQDSNTKPGLLAGFVGGFLPDCW